MHAWGSSLCRPNQWDQRSRTRTRLDAGTLIVIVSGFWRRTSPGGSTSAVGFSTSYRVQWLFSHTGSRYGTRVAMRSASLAPKLVNGASGSATYCTASVRRKSQ